MNRKGHSCRRGQSLLEYSILLIVIIAALIATSSYIKRSMQGRWKTAVDDFGDQYDPRTANGIVTHTINSISDTVVSLASDTGGVWTQRQDTTNSTENKNGTVTVN